jgi:hypothetical protein
MKNRGMTSMFFRLFNVYKAPGLQFLSFLDAFESTVSSVADLSEIVFLGDFNLDPAGNFRFFNESVNSFNLSFVESGPTRITATSSITLDRFVVNDLELVILDYIRTVEEPIVRYFRALALQAFSS